LGLVGTIKSDKGCFVGNEIISITIKALTNRQRMKEKGSMPVRNNVIPSILVGVKGIRPDRKIKNDEGVFIF
jgi:hypothetical protein